MGDENTINDPLYNTLGYSNAQFDKNVLFIASGALGISFAFIEKITPLDKACHKEDLIISWYLFAATILISLISHFVSAMAIRWAIMHRDKDEGGFKEKRWNRFIRSLNVLMIFLLCAGLYFLISFLKLNI